jgi:hypothetical protein
MTAGSPQCLPSLPAEILISIFHQVDLRSLKCLRQSCKSFCPLVEPILFHTTVIVPHIDSLKTLVSLSEHPTLRHCVQRLIYDNRWGNFTSLLRGRYCKDYGILDWRGNTIARKKDLQASGLLDQLSREVLTKDSIDVEIAYLSRSLSMLPSLSSLWCQEPDVWLRRDSTRIPSFYARALTKDQVDAPRWDNLGYPDDPLGSWGVLSVLTAMFATKMSVLDLRIDDVGWKEMFRSTHRLDVFRTVLAPVRRLKFSTTDDLTGYVADAFPNVGSVVASMSCLQDLELNFHYSEFSPPRRWSLGSGEYWEMPRSSVSEIFPKQTYFPHLVRLSLFGFRSEETRLLSFLERHARTLSVLQLGNATLISDACSGAHPCWVRVIRRLQADLDLKEMRFAKLLNGSSQRWKISDLGEYSGPDCLKAQVEHFVVHGGTCPLEDVAVGARQDGERKSRGSFYGDSSWKRCKHSRYLESVSDREND